LLDTIEVDETGLYSFVFVIGVKGVFFPISITLLTSIVYSLTQNLAKGWKAVMKIDGVTQN